MNLGSTGNANAFIASLANAFGVSAASTGDNLKIYNSLNSYAGTVVSGDHYNDDDTAPKAFVTILFFDKNYNLIDAAWDQVSTVGAQTSATVKQPPHDQITATAKAPEAGYAYIFFSNEHPTYVDVYVDDVTVTHMPSPIVSSSDFMPFGLAFNSAERTGTGTFEQKYLYNGKELQDELSLNWYDYGARMYMPELGRWGAVDPLAENSRRWSPYHYAYDNQIRYIDPDGMMSEAYRGGMGGMESMEEDETDRQRRDLINSVNRALEGGGNTVAAKESSTESESSASASSNTSTSTTLSYNSRTRERREALQNQNGGPGKKVLTHGADSPNPLKEPVKALGWLVCRLTETAVDMLETASQNDIGFGPQALISTEAKGVVILVREGGKIVAKNPNQVPKLAAEMEKQLIKPTLTPTVGKAVTPEFIERAEGTHAKGQNPGFWGKVRDVAIQAARFFE